MALQWVLTRLTAALEAMLCLWKDFRGRGEEGRDVGGDCRDRA